MHVFGAVSNLIYVVLRYYLQWVAPKRDSTEWYGANGVVFTDTTQRVV